MLNEKFVRDNTRAANEYYEKIELDPDFIVIAIDFIIRYLNKILPAIPRDHEVLYAAAYYVALKHPFSHPNYHTKEAIAQKFDIKLSSLNWYVQRLLEDLDFLILHDDQARPYYIDCTRLISSVVHSITDSTLHEHLIKAVIRESYPDIFTVQEKIVNILIENLRILPAVFRRELELIVHDLIKDQITVLEL